MDNFHAAVKEEWGTSPTEYDSGMACFLKRPWCLRHNIDPNQFGVGKAVDE